MRDIQEGIEVTHASDLIKAKKQAKRDAKEARLEAKENKVIKNMKKLLNGDDENLKEFAERELKRKGIVVEEKPEQLSMF